MSLWSVIAEKIKEILRGAQKMVGARTIEQTLHVTPVISSQMEEAIQLWTDMYKNQAYWLHEPSRDNPVKVVSLGLPSMIASEKARMALLEFESEVTTPTVENEIPNPDYKEPEKDEYGNLIPSKEPPTIVRETPVTDTARADFMNSQYKKLKANLRRQLEYAIAKGGLVIKPFVVFTGNENTAYGEGGVIPSAYIEFDYIHADCFYPLAFNVNGDITEAAFVQTKVEGNVVYRRLEYHKWSGNAVSIINKAFKATNDGAREGNMNGLDLGKEVSLSEVPEWADLSERIVIQNVTKPLFAYFKMPEANVVDTTSPLGASGYSRAVKNIREADLQYSRLLWEYEGGELAVDIDRDALRTGEDAKGNLHTEKPYMQERLFRKVDLGAEGDTYNVFAPGLRDTSYIQGLNTILMRIEDICGISRGTLSDVTSEARTATELKILKQRSYQANGEIQKALEKTLRDVLYVMDVYCTLYNIVGDITYVNGVPQDASKGQWDVSFEWDDSILTDVNEELNKRIMLQQNGLASKLENRMWYFGETERQAKEALFKIETEEREAMESSLLAENDIAT